jgi:8-oxo-dGTP diphosphatase
VSATASHPDTAALGWSVFRTMVEAASLPVYALGGMRQEDVSVARQAGGQGAAGIRGFW